MTLTLAGGHKVIGKQDQFASFSGTLFKGSGWILILCWRNSNWISCYCFRVRLIVSREIPTDYHDVGLVVKRLPWERKTPGLNPACAGIFSGSSHTSDLKNGTPVATLPGTWCYRVSAGTFWPGVSILWLGEMESLVCNFYLSVAARKIVWADPSLRYTSMLPGR